MEGVTELRAVESTQGGRAPLTILHSRAPKDILKQLLSTNAPFFKTPGEAAACVINIVEKCIQGAIDEGGLRRQNSR